MASGGGKEEKRDRVERLVVVSEGWSWLERLRNGGRWERTKQWTVDGGREASSGRIIGGRREGEKRGLLKPTTVVDKEGTVKLCLGFRHMSVT